MGPPLRTARIALDFKVRIRTVLVWDRGDSLTRIRRAVIEACQAINLQVLHYQARRSLAILTAELAYLAFERFDAKSDMLRDC